MNKRFTLAPAIFALLIAQPGTAQDLMDRAGQAVGGLGGTFNQDAVDNVVTPYTTSSPPETGLGHTQFEDEIGRIRAGGQDDASIGNRSQTRVLKATEDSYAIRPDVEIDGQGALFDDANFAHTNADEIAGRYFSGESGECTTTELPVSEARDEFCESFPARENRTCTITRRIWVDRTDRYRCDRRATNYVRLCDKRVRFTCKIDTNKNACIKNNVRFPGSTVTWAGNVATVTVRGHGGGPVSPRGTNNPGFRYAALARHNVTIQVSDRFIPEAVVLREMSGNGAMQLVRQNRTAIATAAGKPVPGFNSAPATGGVNPPQTPNEGLLLPHTDLQRGKLWAFSAKYEMRPSIGGCRVTRPSSQTIYALGFDYNNATIDQSLCNTYWYDPDERGFHRHPYYAKIDRNSRFRQTTFYTVPLQGFATANPTGNKRFKDAGHFKVRYVYDSTLGANVASTFKLSFEGACCDRFVDEGPVQCN